MPAGQRIPYRAERRPRLVEGEVLEEISPQGRRQVRFSDEDHQTPGHARRDPQTQPHPLRGPGRGASRRLYRRPPAVPRARFGRICCPFEVTIGTVCSQVGQERNVGRGGRIGQPQPRGVAQSGSAPGWGPGGRRFKSCLPDYRNCLQIASCCSWALTPEGRRGAMEQLWNKVSDNGFGDVEEALHAAAQAVLERSTNWKALAAVATS